MVSVCLFVCVLATSVDCAKMVKPIVSQGITQRKGHFEVIAM